MINLETFFTNLFDTERISDDSMDLFAQDHIARLKANNSSSLYDTIIAETQVAYQAYYSAKTSESVQLAQREGTTINVNNLVAEFIQLVSQKEGFIKGIWGKESSQYQEFYPQGVREYYKINRANSRLRMERYLQVATKYVLTLPDGFVDDFASIIDAFKIQRKKQLSLMGSISGSKSKTAKTRHILEIQLMHNLHIIAADYIGKPDVVKAFFTQRYVENAKHKTTDGNLLKGTIEQEQTIELWYETFDATTEFTFKNTGETRLQFYTALLPSDPVPETALELQAGETATVFAFELGAAENLYLMVHNPNVEAEGAYQVSK